MGNGSSSPRPAGAGVILLPPGELFHLILLGGLSPRVLGKPVDEGQSRRKWPLSLKTSDDMIRAFWVVRMGKITGALRVAGGAILAIGLSISIAFPVAAAASTSKPKMGIGPGGLTSARLCSFVGASEVQGLLGGATPEGTGTPQLYNLGSAECTWATANGANTSLSVSTNPGIKGCNGSKGKVLHIAGWSGCLFLPSEEVGMDAEKGKYNFEFTTDGIKASASLTSAMEKVVTQVFKDVHA